MIRIDVLVWVIAPWFCLVFGVSAITRQDIEAKFAAMASYEPDPGQPFSEEDFALFLRDLVADIRLEGVGIDQLEALTPLFLYHAETRQRMIHRLDALREDRGTTGARALVMELALKARNASPEEMAAVVGETLAHPGIGDDIRSGKGSDLFSILRGLPRDALAPNAEALAGLSDTFDPAMSRRALALSTDYPAVISELSAELGEERVAAILARFERLMAEAAPGGQVPGARSEKTDMHEAGGVIHQ